MIESSEGLRALAEALEAAHSSGDVDFDAFLRDHRPATELELAGLIEHDGYLLRARGRVASLERYLLASPDLPDRRVALDAALEATLRSMTDVAGMTLEDAMARLSGEHPQLAEAIRASGALTATLSVTRLARLAAGRPPERDLPCGFGPIERSGARRYRLLERVGEGASSVVYRARDARFSDEATETLVAVKTLASTGAAALRVRSEALASRSVSHEGVVAPIDHGVGDEGEPYLVSPWIEGVTLDVWLGDGRSRREIAALVADLAEALHAAHESGVLHLDLHLRNVLVDREGRPRLVDFGLARREGAIDDDPDAPLGALGFVSPEQYRMSTRGVSARSDVYSLGGMLHYALVRRLPNGASREEARRRLEDRHAPPVGPRDHDRTVDLDLDRLVRRALAPRPEARTPSAQHLADDLRRYLDRRPLTWGRTPPHRRAWLLVRRRPVVSALSVATVALLIGMTIAISFTVGLIQTRRATVERFREELRARTVGQTAEAELAAHLPVMEGMAWIEGVYATASGRPLPAPASDRLLVFRRIVEEGYEHAERPDYRVLIWELGLAHLLLADRELRPETGRVLERNRAGWEALGVDAASEVFEHLDVLEAVRTAKLAYFAAFDAGRAGHEAPSPEQVARAAERLRGATAETSPWNEGSPLVDLARRALRNLEDRGIVRPPAAEPAGTSDARGAAQPPSPDPSAPASSSSPSP